jgi:Tol biopolymer transport system component
LKYGRVKRQTIARIGVCLVLLVLAAFSLSVMTRSSVADPDWSPDGGQIAWSSYYFGHGVYVMNADGSDHRRLTGYSISARQPGWSPSGDEIVFSSDGRVCIVNVIDTDQVRCVTDPSMRAAYPTWSPDGRHIAFLSVGDDVTAIYVVDVDGGGLHHLVDCSPGSGYYPRPIAWSPDGSQIAFVADRSVIGDGALGASALYVIDMDGDNLHHVTHQNGCLTWPEKATIVLCGYACYSTSVIGGDSRRITETLDRDMFPFARPCLDLSPDRSQVVFVAGGEGGQAIYVMDADGGGPYRLTRRNIWDILP